MNDFPAFMKSALNHVDGGQQNTDGIDGYYYEGKDGGQTAFWTCRSPQVSREHAHPFDEYVVCVQGQYTAGLDGRVNVRNPGDELYIPKGTVQSGRCAADTRTIHAFGGRRVRQPE
jgi:quercetin dioxygenase-like cupin family protein